MEKEEKELLLRDLSARLPYGVKCCFRYSIKSKILREADNFVLTPTLYDIFTCKRFEEDYIKPYLRPMSSMTEEEMSELSNLNSGLVFRKNIIKNIILDVYYKTDAIDWLNAHHFDYRGLIEKGLALQAPEGMYNQGIFLGVNQDSTHNSEIKHEWDPGPCWDDGNF